MEWNRREFLKIAGATTAVTAFGGLGFDLTPAHAEGQAAKLKFTKQTTSVCCYCSVGCGLIASTDKDGKGRVVNIEGDPDHPINEGALCPKGASHYQLGTNERRIQKVMYRAPFSETWEEKSWDWALDRIARKVKEARDGSFVTKDAKGRLVNRCEGIASVGSAAMDNEECWIYQSMLRAMGLSFIEHQARICHSATVAALAESFGRGAMTNHWIDIANSDCIFIIGSNAAENHPISFKWALRAKDKGASIIHVDPRYTRTSQHADVFARLRSGSDIPFFGGLIRYILANNLIFKDYVVNYTNASFILGDKYDFKDGLFSGFNAEKRSYDKSAWSFVKDENGRIKKDPTLQDPRCVYQILKKHYDRYDMKSVSAITGTPVADLQRVYQTYAATGKPEKSGTMLYAMGQTQHTVGVQNIRAMSIIQLLLGNMGVAGGGINALRGEANVQGSTDQGLLFHILPGYIPTPNATMATLAEFNEKNTPATKDPQSANWWGNRPKYMASLLKSMYPNQELDVAYDYMPKLEPGKDYSWLSLFDAMLGGAFKGFFAWGQNPAASTANANKTREAMTKLDWMVTVNMFETETGSFWKGPGMDPKKVKTEVFYLPCAVSFEKEGSISNSGRWMQWRYAAQAPTGDSKPDGDIIYELFEKIRALYAKEGGAFPDPIKNLNWDVATNHAFDPHKVAKLINGFFLKEKTIKVGDADKTFKPGDPVPSFAMLQTDGSTCSGNWIYAGSYTDKNNAARRDKTQTAMQAKIGLYPGWTWAWPVNRRVLYNRASVDPQGKPYQPEKAVIAWVNGKWEGDVPDGPWPPMADSEKGKYPFIMTTEGMGQIFGPGRNDGPLPEHYEPLECPIGDNPFSKQLHNPKALKFTGPTEEHASCDPRFPFICSTYRVTEHWQTGVMTRNSPWLLEAEPQMFCEMSPELAKMRGIKNGEKVILESTRGSLWAKAIVTERIQPFTVLGQTIHQVGIPWHYGWTWPKNGGDSANILCPSVGDPNTGIPETKAFMVNVRKA